ncbi:hypothetical protein EJ06DRAFT_512087 [Trichodelitschia bisporula]|uniref:Pre-rRNA processing protein n=1 Tax=Trichodelitschia bisporula TaxID=703511 RepID=A0A6G1HSR0_9PEZI|nr:hypothetical protein EJ06DRAFT_512087 [Trichodelitschia bisporula]
MPDYATIDTPTRSSSRPASHRSTTSARSLRSSRTSEATPLLAPSSDDVDETTPLRSPSASSLLQDIIGDARKPEAKRPRWPSFVALGALCVLVALIMVAGFVVPQAAEEYAKQARVFEITSVSLPEFTATGARARVQGVFWLDADRVGRQSVRDLGRFGTWIARKVELRETRVRAYLPEYGDVVIGTAKVPGVKVDVRNGRKTVVDVLADLEPGDVDGIRQVADAWLAGRLGELTVRGVVDVTLKSGIFSLGRQTVEQSMVFAGDDVPALPAFNISKLNIHEVDLPDATQGMAADVTIKVQNGYPLDIVVPPLGFAILVDNCSPAEPFIMLADATTNWLAIHPREDVVLNVTGVVRRLPDAFTAACPDSEFSPLDTLLGSYMHGEDTTIHVRGSDAPSLDTPRWISDLISGITVPVPIPGHSFGNLVRNFTLADVHFSLPDPMADPDTPESNPQISATIKAVIALPEEMNLSLDVNKIRATADIFYKKRKLGVLDLHKWQPATSHPLGDAAGPALLIESAIASAPLSITDDDVFADVVQALLFGSKPLMLSVTAAVDVHLDTALGPLTIRRVPAQGTVPVKPIRGPGTGGFVPQVGNLSIIETTEDSLTIAAVVNVTNPTMYKASVPYADVLILVNGTRVGHAMVRDMVVVPGVNAGLKVMAVWNPAAGGRNASAVGRALLSQYISGRNVSLTLRTHAGTLPSQPRLGRALSFLNLTLPAPRLGGPPPPSDPNDGDDEDDGKPHFIRAATMHLLSSTADFTLLSPLQHTTLFITRINATSFYKGAPVGKILHDLPFAVPPGESLSPRLGVEWDLGSVGYEAVKRALGGTLRLSARAEVGVRVGRWEERVDFVGKGIGAHVRL